MSRLKIVSGLPYKIVIESWNTHAPSSSQEVLLWKAAPRGLKEKRERPQSVPLTLPGSYSLLDRFHIVSLFLSNPCTPSTLSKEAFVYFVLCPTEIPQPPFAWKYYRDVVQKVPWHASRQVVQKVVQEVVQEVVAPSPKAFVWHSDTCCLKSGPLGRVQK